MNTKDCNKPKENKATEFKETFPKVRSTAVPDSMTYEQYKGQWAKVSRESIREQLKKYL